MAAARVDTITSSLSTTSLSAFNNNNFNNNNPYKNAIGAHSLLSNTTTTSNNTAFPIANKSYFNNNNNNYNKQHAGGEHSTDVLPARLTLLPGRPKRQAPFPNQRQNRPLLKSTNTAEYAPDVPVTVARGVQSYSTLNSAIAHGIVPDYRSQHQQQQQRNSPTRGKNHENFSLTVRNETSAGTKGEEDVAGADNDDDVTHAISPPKRAAWIFSDSDSLSGSPDDARDDGDDGGGGEGHGVYTTWNELGCYYTPYRGTTYSFRSAQEMLALTWYTGSRSDMKLMDERTSFVLRELWCEAKDFDIIVRLKLNEKVHSQFESEQQQQQQQTDQVRIVYMKDKTDEPNPQLRPHVDVKAHRSVLCRWSHYFRRLIYLWECRGNIDPHKVDVDRNMLIVSVNRYWPYISVLRWMYTGVVAMPAHKSERLFEVVQAAVHFKCFDLMRLCRSCFDPASQLKYSPSAKLIEMLLDSDSVKPLVRVAAQKLLHKLTDLAHTNTSNDYRKWNFSRFFKLVSDANLAIRSEVDVHKAIIHWIEADREMRMTHLEELLDQVNWQYMEDVEVQEAVLFRPDLFAVNSPLYKFIMNGLWVRSLLFQGKFEGLENELRPYRCFTVDELERMTATTTTSVKAAGDSTVTAADGGDNVIQRDALTGVTTITTTTTTTTRNNNNNGSKSRYYFPKMPLFKRP